MANPLTFRLLRSTQRKASGKNITYSWAPGPGGDITVNISSNPVGTKKKKRQHRVEKGSPYCMVGNFAKSQGRVA